MVLYNVRCCPACGMGVAGPNEWCNFYACARVESERVRPSIQGQQLADAAPSFE
jgi:hypothetical protein